jgi:hypothetical protein
MHFSLPRTVFVHNLLMHRLEAVCVGRYFGRELESKRRRCGGINKKISVFSDREPLHALRKSNYLLNSALSSSMSTFLIIGFSFRRLISAILLFATVRFTRDFLFNLVTAIIILINAVNTFSLKTRDKCKNCFPAYQVFAVNKS